MAKQFDLLDCWTKYEDMFVRWLFMLFTLPLTFWLITCEWMLQGMLNGFQVPWCQTLSWNAQSIPQFLLAGVHNHQSVIMFCKKNNIHQMLMFCKIHLCIPTFLPGSIFQSPLLPHFPRYLLQAFVLVTMKLLRNENARLLRRQTCWLKGSELITLW